MRNNLRLESIYRMFGDRSALNDYDNGISDVYKDVSGIDVANSNISQSLLVCEMAGANGTSTFSDESKEHTLTPTNTTYSNGTTGKFTDYPAYFNGTSAHVITDDSPDWDFGTGDSTINLWVRPTNLSGAFRPIGGGASGDGANQQWALGIGDLWGSNSLNLVYWNGSGYSEQTWTNVPIYANTWHLLTLMRKGDYWYAAIDGGGSLSPWYIPGVAINSGSTGIILGARFDNNGSTIIERFAGYMQAVEVIKGTAVYPVSTGYALSFTPPTTMPVVPPPLTGAFTGTLTSETFTAAEAPSIVDVMLCLREIDTLTPNTNLIVEARREAAETWEAGTLVQVATYAGGGKVFACSIDVSGQDTGTAVQYRVRITGSLTAYIDGVSCDWRA